MVRELRTLSAHAALIERDPRCFAAVRPRNRPASDVRDPARAFLKLPLRIAKPSRRHARKRDAYSMHVRISFLGLLAFWSETLQTVGLDAEVLDNLKAYGDEAWRDTVRTSVALGTVS